MNNKLWIGVAVVGLLILWLLSRNSNAPSDTTYTVDLPGGQEQTTASTPPTYLTYNFPKLPDVNIWVPTTQNSNSNSAAPGSCGCVGPSPDFFSSLSSLLANYEAKISGFANDYIANLSSAFPDFVSQYFNATGGASLYNTSSKFLGG